MATLAQLAQAYLNQGLPSISGIFQPKGPSIPTPVPVAPEPGITPQLLQPMGGGGDGFSVYNPDPNRTRNESNYNERPYKSTVYNNAFPMMGDPMANQATGALNADGLMSYPGDKPPTGLEKLIGMLPGQQVLKGITNMLPVNRTGILQNELLGAGFQLNDIGQIVGDPRTVEGVMAGLNSSRMDAGSFDKKSAGIESTLSDKYGLSKGEIDSIKAGNITDAIKDKAYNKTMGTTSNLVQDLYNTKIAKDKFLDVIDKTETIFDDKSLAKDPSYKSLDEKIKEGLLEGDDDDDEFDPTNPLKIDPISKKNAITNKIFQKTINDIKQKEIEKQNAIDPSTNYYVPDGTSGGGAGQGIDISGAGTVRSSDNNFQGDSGPTNQQESDYGYSTDFGFARGGRVKFLNGGLADLVYLLGLK